MTSIRRSLSLDSLAEKAVQFKAGLKGKDRLGADGIGQGDKATTVAIEKFSRLNVVKNLTLLASRKFILTKVDGQKVFINKKSFNKSGTIDATYLKGLIHLGSQYNKGELIKELLSMKHTPLETADEVKALQFEFFGKLNKADGGDDKSTLCTMLVMKTEKGMEIKDITHTLGQGTFGRVSSLGESVVLKQAAINPSAELRMTREQKASHLDRANKDNLFEAELEKTLDKRFAEKHPGETPVAFGGSPSSKIVNITTGPNQKIVGRMMAKLDHDLTHQIYPEKDPQKLLEKDNLLAQTSLLHGRVASAVRDNPELAKAQRDVENAEQTLANALPKELQTFKNQTLSLAFQTLKGLSQMHSVNVFHRDIKPDNIMFTHDGKVRFVDFGLACDTQKASQQITGCGTPIYFNLTEQQDIDKYSRYMGDSEIKNALGKADVLALGLTLYETMNLGTSRYAYRKDQNVWYADFNQPQQLQPGVRELFGSEFVNLVLRMTEEKQANRPSAEQALNQMKAIVAKNPELKQTLDSLGIAV